ncbi:hypothetical protein [Streptomyces rhizosphaericus]|uniref:hypothetical protein n=1 Tax=Streptomyces rhizosphaericus TaxID=114699 RepID=UPI00363B9019
MVVLYVLLALVVVGLLTGVHWYVWRRLVRDTTARGGWARRTGTAAAFALPLISVGALIAGRAGAPFPSSAPSPGRATSGSRCSCT